MRWPLGNEVFHPLGDRLADPRAAAGPDCGRGGGANAHSFGIWDFEKGSAGPLGGGSWAFARLPPFPFHRSAPGEIGRASCRERWYMSVYAVTQENTSIMQR